MKITNRIAGTWKLFSEEMPPEEEGTWVDLYMDDAVDEWCKHSINWFDAETRLWIDYDGCGVSSAYLAEEYDAYCVIRGPWEDGE